MGIERSSGILMHITSLPGKYGIGTLGGEAREFVDWLILGGQWHWQILPLGPVSPAFGCSPYSALSSFAGNPLVIDLESLREEAWLRSDILSGQPLEEAGETVDFDGVVAHKIPALEQAASDFFTFAGTGTMEEFDAFCEAEKDWLEDYALFAALAGHFQTHNWLDWQPGISLRGPGEMATWRKNLEDRVRFHQFGQFIFFSQWRRLKEYCREKGISVIGDIPIYVNFDSADTWANPGIFALDENTRQPTRVAGVPPDYFSETGQRWGNPLYRWRQDGELNGETMDWWEARFRHTLRLVDRVRVDHFRGFEAFWAIPREEETAVKGRWEKGPDREFFDRLHERLGRLPLVAEDLGVITPEVESLRDGLGLPGMKILQFAFGGGPDNPYLPHNFKNSNCVVYTGTHDNNTTPGWFSGGELGEDQKKRALSYLPGTGEEQLHWRFIRLALSTVADLAIIPVQDLLGLGAEARMNTPGEAAGNWSWKLPRGRLDPEIMQKLRDLCIIYNRVRR